MRNSSKSFANEFGISHKNLSSNPSLGIGLNPNLNIEDEYIQNLLKQIHFLNMQIKLIKEKQKQNKGMGIMGLLNKDSNPVVTHAITSNDKFSQMKNKLGQVVNDHEVKMLKLQDDIVAGNVQVKYLKDLYLKQQQKNFENRREIQKKINDGIDQLKKLQSKVQELRTQGKKIGDNHEKLKHQYEDLDIKALSKDLIKTILLAFEQQSFSKFEQHHKSNIKGHQQTKNQIDKKDKGYREDPNYINLIQQGTDLKKKLNQTQIALFKANYQVKQKEQLKKLAIRNKDVQNEHKKQVKQQMQKLKKKLEDKKLEYDSRLTENKNGLQTNDEIRLAKGKIARKDKQINDLKRKTQISQNNYKKLRDDEMKLKKQLDQRKKRNQFKLNSIKQNKILLNQKKEKKRQAQLQYQQSINKLTVAEKQLQNERLRLQACDKTSKALQAKQHHLTTSIDMDEGLRKVKIQQLTNLIQSNNGLNNTINDLMGKWEQIIKFTRQSPSN